MIPPRYLGAAKVLSLALLVIIAASVLLWLGTNSVQVANEGRADVGGTVEFDGEKRRYDVLLSYRALQGTNTPERLAGRVDCTVALSGDPYTRLDGARQGTRTISDTATSIGSFDGREGRLGVRCDWDGTRPLGANNRFIVAAQRTRTRNVAHAGWALGGLLVIAGLLMVRRAGRQP